MRRHPTPGDQDSLDVLYYPVDVAGHGNSIGLITFGNTVPVYVNPQAAPPAGRLDYVVEWGDSIGHQGGGAIVVKGGNAQNQVGHQIAPSVLQRADRATTLLRDV